MDHSIENYGLENIALHHSFGGFAGRTVRVECKERTHVGGTNGAGKTSILQLIPAFYGEEPERIVNRAGGRDSFVDFYLKSQQSLIIFEYRRSSGLCCAALHRHPTGKLCYRFIEGGLEDTFFSPDIKGLLEQGASSTEVFQAFREKGINYSKLIDTITDYRAVIQNNPRLIKRHPAEARRLQALANDFSVGGLDIRMSHVDRMTHVVLNKSRLLSSFKSMICETMFNDIHLNKRPMILHERDLVNDILSLKAFEAEESAIRQCLVKDAERKGIMERATNTARKLRLTKAADASLKQDIQDDIEAQSKELETKESDFSDQHQELSLKSANINSDITAIKNRLETIYRQRDDYEDRGLPELDSDLKNLNEYRQQHKNAIEDYEALTTKVADLESEHERRITKIAQRFTESQGQRNKSLEAATQALKDQSKAHEHNLTKLNGEAKDEVSEYRHARQSQRSEHREHQVRLKTQIELANFTQEEQQQIEEAVAALEQQDQETRRAKEELSEATEKRTQARHDRDTAQRHLDQAEATANKLDEEFNALQRQLTPNRDSWLAQLREDTPEWGRTLGKVINPDLLMREDLAPILAEAASLTVMGWEIDTSVLPVPDIADSEEEIQAKLQKKDGERQKAHQNYKEAETAAEKSNALLQEREREIEQVAGRCRIHEGHFNSAKSSLASIRTAAEQALKERTAALRRELDSKTEMLEEFDRETEKTIETIEKRHAQTRMDALGQWAERKSEIEADIENAKSLVENAEREHEERLKTLNQAYESRLKDEGVDPEKVRRAREKKDELEKKIHEVEQAQTEVHEYRSWQTQEWSQTEKLQSDAADLARKKEMKDREIADLTKTFNNAKKEITDSIKSKRQRVSGITAKIAEADTILGKFPEVTDEATGIPGNIKTLTEDLQDAHRNLEKLKQEVVKAVRKAAAVLGKYENTQVYKAWQNLQDYRVNALTDKSDRFTEEFELGQTDSLRFLLDRDLPQLKSILVDQFASAAGELGDYLDSLKLMVREVKQVSNNLQQAINTDQQIDSLSDIRVLLKPRIYEDESWVPLKNFVETWKDWQLSHRAGRDVPSEELIKDFQVVVNTLRSARLGGDVESMVDMALQLRENGRLVEVRTDNDLLNASSTGLTYLAIMAIFAGMTRYLAPDTRVRITWPIDELGTLSAENVSKLADMLEKQNISMISACPKLDHGLRKFFENKVSIRQGQINIFGQKSESISPKHSNLFSQLSQTRTEVHDHAE